MRGAVRELGTGQRLTVAVAVIGLAAVILGYFGFRQAESDLGSVDATYQALQLLALEYNGPQEPPLLLEIARFLGALALGLAILLALVALARDRFAVFLISHLASRHAVVVGIGERGSYVIRSLKADGMRVVGMDLDREGRARAEDDGGSIAFIEADARIKGAYRKAAAAKARHVIFALGTDSANLQALETCVEYINSELGDAEHQPTLHVLLEEEDLWRTLHGTSLTWSGAGGAVEFIFLPDRVGLAMVEPVSLELEVGDPPELRRMVVWGSGPKAVRTAVRMRCGRRSSEEAGRSSFWRAPRSISFVSSCWPPSPGSHPG